MPNNSTRDVSIDDLVDFVSFNTVYSTIDNAIGAAEEKQRKEYENGGEEPFYSVLWEVLNTLDTEEHRRIRNKLSDAFNEYNHFSCETSYKQGVFIGLKLYGLFRRLQDEGVL
jgi:hypothetical protein